MGLNFIKNSARKYSIYIDYINKLQSSSNEIVFDQSHPNKFTIIGLNRPKSKNALGKNLVKEFEDALACIKNDESSKCVIIGSLVPNLFCAGADLKERAGMKEEDVGPFVKKARIFFNKIANLSIPTICAIDGPALGGGLELALACDLRYATENSIMGLVETRLGIIPGAGGTQRLPRIVGIGTAKDLIFTVNGTVKEDESGLSALVKAMEVASEISLSCDPVAVKMTKKSIDEVDIGLAALWNMNSLVQKCRFHVKTEEVSLDSENYVDNRRKFINNIMYLFYRWMHYVTLILFFIDGMLTNNILNVILSFWFLSSYNDVAVRSPNILKKVWLKLWYYVTLTMIAKVIILRIPLTIILDTFPNFTNGLIIDVFCFILFAIEIILYESEYSHFMHFHLCLQDAFSSTGRYIFYLLNEQRNKQFDQLNAKVTQKLKEKYAKLDRIREEKNGDGVQDLYRFLRTTDLYGHALNENDDNENLLKLFNEKDFCLKTKEEYNQMLNDGLNQFDTYADFPIVIEEKVENKEFTPYRYCLIRWLMAFVKEMLILVANNINKKVILHYLALSQILHTSRNILKSAVIFHLPETFDIKHLRKLVEENFGLLGLNDPRKIDKFPSLNTDRGVMNYDEKSTVCGILSQPVYLKIYSDNGAFVPIVMCFVKAVMNMALFNLHYICFFSIILVFATTSNLVMLPCILCILLRAMYVVPVPGRAIWSFIKYWLMFSILIRKYTLKESIVIDSMLLLLIILSCEYVKYCGLWTERSRYLSKFQENGFVSSNYYYYGNSFCNYFYIQVLRKLYNTFGILLSGFEYLFYKRYWKNNFNYFKQWYKRTFYEDTSISRDPTDVYTLTLIFEICSALLILFDFKSFYPVYTHRFWFNFLTERKVSVPLLIIMLVQFIIILIDRALNLKKSVIAKQFFQLIYFSAITTWLYLLMRYNESNATMITPILFFICKYIYFILTAFQIKYGYSTVHTRTPLSSYHTISYVLYTIYLLFPLLQPFRIFFDWMFTNSITCVAHWMYLEDLTVENSICYYWRMKEKDNPSKISKPYGAIHKVLLATVLMALILVIVWIAPVTRVIIDFNVKPYNVDYCEASFRIGNLEPIYKYRVERSSMNNDIAIDQIYGLYNSTLPGINGIYKMTKSQLLQACPNCASEDDIVTYSYLLNFRDRDITKLTFKQKSSMFWFLTPEYRNDLKRTLKDKHEKLNLYFELFCERSGIDNSEKTVRFKNKLTLNHQRKVKLYEMLFKMNGNLYLEIDNLVPLSFTAYKTGMVQTEVVANKFHTIRLQSSVLNPGPYNDVYIWGIKSVTDMDNNDFGSKLLKGPSLSTLLFRERVSTNFLEQQINNFGSTSLALYLIYIFAADRILKAIVRGSWSRISQYEVADPQRVLNLLDEAVLARNLNLFHIEANCVAKLIYIYKDQTVLIRWSTPIDINDGNTKPKLYNIKID